MKFTPCLRIVFVTEKYENIFWRVNFMFGGIFQSQNFHEEGSFRG